jgi:hypothetical protein
MQICFPNPSRYSTSNIQHPTPRPSILRTVFSCFGSYLEIYEVLFTTTPWLSRTVVHKFKQLQLHS